MEKCVLLQDLSLSLFPSPPNSRGANFNLTQWIHWAYARTSSTFTDQLTPEDSSDQLTAPGPYKQELLGNFLWVVPFSCAGSFTYIHVGEVILFNFMLTYYFFLCLITYRMNRSTHIYINTHMYIYVCTYTMTYICTHIDACTTLYYYAKVPLCHTY